MDVEQELTPDEHRFLRALHGQLGGDTGGSASMFDVGDALGMDRATASRTAENLMGWDLVEVRTLSGAIGITPGGTELIDGSGDDTPAGLGETPVIGDEARQRVDAVTATLKSRVGDMGLGFDALSEVTADLKTIDAQLASPKPKTAILRACLESIADGMDGTGAPDLIEQVRGLAGA